LTTTKCRLQVGHFGYRNRAFWDWDKLYPWVNFYPMWDNYPIGYFFSNNSFNLGG
jgi:hypothetical protein